MHITTPRLPQDQQTDNIEIQNQSAFQLVLEPAVKGPIEWPEASNQSLPQTKHATTANKRLDWIDGMRGKDNDTFLSNQISCTLLLGIAECVIFMHHFGDNTYKQAFPNFLGWASPQVWIQNGQFAVSVFFILSARVLTYSFLTSARNPKKNLRWASLASTVFRRSFRLAIPVALTIVIQALVATIAVFPNMEFARYYLRAEYLFPPSWEKGDIWTYLLKVFTLDDPVAILQTGSSLWSMYPQFWGSIYCYLITIITANMNNFRFAVYLTAALIFFYSTNVHFVFVFGLLLADLDASGYTNRFRRQPTYIVLSFQIILTCIMFFLVINIDAANLVNVFVSANTMRDGVVGWDVWQWPILLQPVNSILLICLFGIVETSPSFQHLFTFEIFVFLGKITFGMYLLQMTIIYTIMPSIVTFLVISFSPSYIAVCTLAFLATFSCTAFIGWVWYKSVDEFSLQSSRSLWNWFTNSESVNRESTFSNIVLELCSMFYLVLLSIPSKSTAFMKRQGDRIWSLSEVFSIRVRQWTYWRDAIPLQQHKSNSSNNDHEKNTPSPPQPEPLLPPPNYEYVFSTDHPRSTNTHQPSRFSRVLFALHFLFYLQLLLVSLVWAVCIYFALPSFQFLSFNIVYQSLLLLLLPYALFLFCGLMFAPPLRHDGEKGMRLRCARRKVLGSLYILLTMDLNEFTSPTRQRSLFFQSLLSVCAAFPFAKIVLLVPERETDNLIKSNMALPCFCTVVAVPESLKGCDASFSLQAVSYFTSIFPLHPSLDWILLLDSPCLCTEVEPSLFLGILEFIRYSKHEVGVGLSMPSFRLPSLSNGATLETSLTSLAHAHTFSTLVSMFSLQTCAIERPVFLHDSCLVLLSANPSNLSGFQLDNLSFLYQWGWSAWQQNVQCGPLNVCVAVQCDASLSSLVATRSSFLKNLDHVVTAAPSLAGFKRLDFKQIGRRISKTFKNMVLVFTSFLLSMPLAVYVDPSPSPSVFWIFIPFSFSLIVVVWSYVVGVVLRWSALQPPPQASSSVFAKSIAAFRLLYSILLTLVIVPFSVVVQVYTIIQSQK